MGNLDHFLCDDHRISGHFEILENWSVSDYLLAIEDTPKLAQSSLHNDCQDHLDDPR